MNEVVPKGATGVRFSDISGQEKAKAALQEMVVLPRFDNDFYRTRVRSLAMLVDH